MFVYTLVKIFLVGVKQFLFALSDICTSLKFHTGGKTNISEYTKFGYNYVTA